MLEFKKERRHDLKGEYDGYRIYRGNRGIADLVRDFVFENDKYEFYSAEEMIEIGEFIKKMISPKV